MKTVLFVVALVAAQCLSWRLTRLEHQVEAQSILLQGASQQAAYNKQEISASAAPWSQAPLPASAISGSGGAAGASAGEAPADQEALEMELVAYMLNDFNTMFRNKRLRDIEHSALLTRYHSLAYSDLLLHRYDNYNELKQSAGPHLNQELCVAQLEQLVKRLNVMQHENRVDSNLEQLLDTFGKHSSGFLVGNLINPGSYFECRRLNIETPGASRLQAQDTRYCLAGLKRPSWPREGMAGELSTKYGVCLPRTCDSTNYKNKYNLVNELLQAHSRAHRTASSEDRLTVANLYCLPDDDSSLRRWWQNPKSFTFAALISGWLALLLVATVKYERRLRASKESSKELEQDEKQVVSASFKTYQMLALTNNLRQLFSTSKPSSMMSGATSGGPAQPKQEVVDLSVLEGIKVICMSYVVMGHVLLYFSSLMNNGREMSEVNVANIAFFAANMLPAFAVNSFFTITGLLTAYLMFKSGQTRSLATVPRKYVAFVLYRYLRIMPVYILAVGYAKYLAKYTGAGPFWDYGTSSLSPRQRCEQESWLWTLTFTANLKPPLEHCVVSAWYLANDFQFFLITPPLLALLDWRPRLGKAVLKAGILAGYLLGMHSIFTSKAPDLRPVASFMPHGFKTYVTHLNSSYTYPQHRIPAYLCGIFIGYVLFEWEKRRLQAAAAAAPTSEQQSVEPAAEQQQQQLPEQQVTSTTGELPLWLRKHQPTISGLAILSCVCLPLIGAHLNANKFWARILVTVCMSTYHIIFSLAIGLYVLAAVTGHGNKLLNDFLSAPIWKPFSRLSLCVVLFNVEVVNYFVQSARQMVYMDFKNQTSFNLLCVTFSYLSAIFICVAFESPIRALLNKILASVIKGANRSEKQKSQ